MLRFCKAYLLFPLLENLSNRAIGVKLRTFRKESALPFEERRRRARVKLVRMLHLAGRYVPYYRETFQRIGFQPDKVSNDINYLDQLPYLTKDIIRNEGDKLLNETMDLGRLHARKTGGSTGPSVSIWYSQQALDWTAAANLLVQEWAGRTLTRKAVNLANDVGQQTQLKPLVREWLKCAALNRNNIFSRSWDEGDLDAMWRRLRKASPYLVHGHPSTLYALALHLQRQGRVGREVFSVFESTGETLQAKQAQAIKDAFHCRIINRYGSAEFGVSAYQTSPDTHDRLAVVDSLVWPETHLGADGCSELVLTGLLNEAMPLIRYRTGDLAELSETGEGYYVHNLMGRIHDQVCIAGRWYPSHYLQDVIDRIPDVDEFQVEPRTNGPLLIHLVVDGPRKRARAERAIRQRWGDAIEIRFIQYSELKRQGGRAKFRYVISEKAA